MVLTELQAVSEYQEAPKVKVVRHTLLFRALHWLLFLEGLILGITGISLSNYLEVNLIEYGLARSLHLTFGFALIGTALFFLYYFVASGEYRWFGLRRIPMAFDFLFYEVKAWFNGDHVPDPIKFNPERGDYDEKVVPTEVLAWWGWFLLGLGIILSGLALIYPEQLAHVNRFWAWVFLDDYGDRMTVATRMGHFLLASLILVMVVVHAYAGWTFRMLRSIVFGDREEPTS